MQDGAEQNRIVTVPKKEGVSLARTTQDLIHSCSKIFLNACRARCLLRLGVEEIDITKSYASRM